MTTVMSHPTSGPHRISELAAALAIAAAVAAAILLGALHVLSPEYSPAWRMVSEYANGHYAWVLSLMFAAYGLSTLAVAFAIRSQLHGRAGRIGLGALPVGAMLISKDLARTAGWSTAGKQLMYAANLTWITVVLWMASFPLMVGTFYHALGTLPSAPPSQLPPGVIALVGWTCRLLIAAAWAWVIVVAWHAIRSQRQATSAGSSQRAVSRALGA